MKSWFLQVAVAFDQLLNTIFCNGWADETMSSNAYRMHRDGKRAAFLCPCIDFLVLMLFHQKDHCKTAHDAEREGYYLPPELRPKKT